MVLYSGTWLLPILTGKEEFLLLPWNYVGKCKGILLRDFLSLAFPPVDSSEERMRSGSQDQPGQGTGKA